MENNTENERPFELRMDGDLKATIDFMVRHISPNKLVEVATALAQLAPVMWDRHQETDPWAYRERFIPLDFLPVYPSAANKAEGLPK